MGPPQRVMIWRLASITIPCDALRTSNGFGDAIGQPVNTAQHNIRILSVDDHPLLRDGIAAVLAGQPDLTLVAEAATGREAVTQFLAHRPDVTLMDLQMPDMDGLAAIQEIRRQAPQACIVVLTTYTGDVQALRAIKAGAMAVLLKSELRSELIDTIRAVHAGRRRFSAEIAKEIAAHASNDQLSEREIAVLKAVAAGNANKRVGGILSISEDTVKTHMKNILMKLCANDRTHAVTIALKRGII
jgi:DNA-binding NarL/FixJ family response regulator